MQCVDTPCSPQEGGIGIETPKDKIVWKCAFRCVEGKPAHDPLIDLVRENAAQVKADIELRVWLLPEVAHSWLTLFARSKSCLPSALLRILHPLDKAASILTYCSHMHTLAEERESKTRLREPSKVKYANM